LGISCGHLVFGWFEDVEKLNVSVLAMLLRVETSTKLLCIVHVVQSLSANRKQFLKIKKLLREEFQKSHKSLVKTFFKGWPLDLSYDL